MRFPISQICVAALVSTPTAGAQITVRIYYYADVPVATRSKASDQANHALRLVGLDTTWLDCSPTEVRSQSQFVCLQRQRTTDLTLTILPETVTARLPADRRELGVAMLSATGDVFSCHANIYFDRVEEVSVRTRIRSKAVILGHAMAHEVGHLLLGTPGHSATGIMRAPWSLPDLVRAGQGALLFTPWQSKRMQENVRQRMLAE